MATSWIAAAGEEAQLHAPTVAGVFQPHQRGRVDAVASLLTSCVAALTVCTRLEAGHTGQALVLLHRIQHSTFADEALRATCRSCSQLLRAPTAVGEMGLSAMVGQSAFHGDVLTAT